MNRSTALLVLGAILAAAGAQAAEAAAPQDLKPLLERTIVGKTLPMTEVQRYCEAAVLRMPAVKTAAEWDAEAARLRQAVLEKVVFRGEAARWRDAPVKFEWLDTIPGGPGYRIKKFRYEALPGLWIPGLLYEPEKLEGKAPVVMNVNGHVGGVGKAYVPKQHRCINQAKRGMLAMNVEWVGMGQLATDGFNHYKMNQIDLCGTSGIAVHYLGINRAMNALVALEHADPARVALTGLSGGGCQTAFYGGLDPRVTFANPVAGYSSFRTRAMVLSDLGDSEQTPVDLAATADYCHLTAMRAPRPTLLTKNAKDDCCFAAGHALPPLLEACKPIYKLYGREDALRSHINHDPGTHNYEVDNRQAFYKMAGDFFYPGSKDYNPKEIPSEKEIKTPKDLEVPLPAKNEDFHTLAAALMKDLPRNAVLPKDRAAAASWQNGRRSALRETVRAKDFALNAVRFAAEEKGGVKAVFWRLQMGPAWTVPAVELSQGEPKKTAVLLADAGRATVSDDAARLLAAGYRVLAVDPFYFGESKIEKLDFLFALLVSAVGDRPLGLQASQVAAVARWSQAEHKTGPVTLVAVGPRSGTFALVAAALEEKAIAAVEVRNPLTSLKEVIERNAAVTEKPELFCFGLLEACDVKQIAALVAPRPVTFTVAAPRAKTDLAGLAEWYSTLGTNHNPLP